ncbi:hypothetical protein BDK51DRAFT_25822, partial [Blyttiomyces helicus]
HRILAGRRSKGYKAVVTQASDVCAIGSRSSQKTTLKLFLSWNQHATPRWGGAHKQALMTPLLTSLHDGKIYRWTPRCESRDFQAAVSSTFGKVDEWRKSTADKRANTLAGNGSCSSATEAEVQCLTLRGSAHLQGAKNAANRHGPHQQAAWQSREVNEPPHKQLKRFAIPAGASQSSANRTQQVTAPSRQTFQCCRRPYSKRYSHVRSATIATAPPAPTPPINNGPSCPQPIAQGLTTYPEYIRHYNNGNHFPENLYPTVSIVQHSSLLMLADMAHSLEYPSPLMAPRIYLLKPSSVMPPRIYHSYPPPTMPPGSYLKLQPPRLPSHIMHLHAWPEHLNIFLQGRDCSRLTTQPSPYFIPMPTFVLVPAFNPYTQAPHDNNSSPAFRGLRIEAHWNKSTSAHFHRHLSARLLKRPAGPRFSPVQVQLSPLQYYSSTSPMLSHGGPPRHSGQLPLTIDLENEDRESLIDDWWDSSPCPVMALERSGVEDCLAPLEEKFTDVHKMALMITEKKKAKEEAAVNEPVVLTMGNSVNLHKLGKGVGGGEATGQEE